MQLQRRSVDLGERGSVSAVIALPDDFEPGGLAVVLAHGAGNDMTNPLLSAVHEGLAGRGCATVKFNFPYKERGRRAPDPAPVLEACYERVIDAVRADPKLRPRDVVLGGKSLGGRMASHLAARRVPCAGLLFLGYPLHPPRRPDKLRAAHLAQIQVPMLFFAGTRDALCDLDLLRRTIGRLPAPVILHVVEGGDHSFAVPKALHRPPEKITEEIVAVSADWLAKLAPHKTRK